MSGNNLLTVYKASAGSGKTYTLTQQYIKLLIQAHESNNEEKFRHILAVTFTNKATDEMKSRIVERLYEISQQETSEIIDGEELTPQRAKEILKSILHNYSFFRITTIDKFFQQIIRSFVRELGLNSNYAIELDEKEVISDTISDILLNLGEKEYETFMKWFTQRLIKDSENTEEDVKFNSLKEKLESLCGLITKDRYAQIKDELPNDDNLATAIGELKATYKNIEEYIRNLANEALDEIQKCGLSESDFKKGAITQIRTSATDRSKAFPDELKPTTSAWEGGIVATKDKMKMVESKLSSTALGKLQEYVQYVKENTIKYYSAKYTVQNLPYMQLFKRIEEEINNRTKENNIQLLSKSGDLIKTIIEGSDAPFIYEKVGSFIEHYFIDEFQDTSHLQWDNFKPLIKESTSSNNSNLIVGDIKQSIYRFRDSDWEILGQEVQDDFRNEYKQENLQTNRRSCKNIIEFNNQLFMRLSAFMQKAYNMQSGENLNTMITDAYADVKQEAPKEERKETSAENQGYIEINFIPSQKKNNDDNDVATEEYENILNDINDLIDHGYNYSDIGILVRWNNEAQSIAQHLLSHGINVISEEALKISSNEAVANIVSILGYLVNRNSKANRYLVTQIINKDNKLDVDHLSTLPLYEAIEEIIFQLEYDQIESNQPYLSGFKDLVSSYISKKGANTRNFLDWWNEYCLSKSLTTTSTADAVNILTIHKSKGLAYKALIMPDINWVFQKQSKTNIIWANISNETLAPLNSVDRLPYNGLNHVILDCKPTMAKTIYKKDYYDELLMTYIDNINFLYVAFTRAKEVLIAYCPGYKADKDPFKDISKKEFSSMYETLLSGFSSSSTALDSMELNALPLEISQENEFGMRFCKGITPTYAKEAKEAHTPANLENTTESISPEEKLKRFPLRGEEFKEFNRDYSNRDYGTRMHSIMERIKTVEDIDIILDEIQFKGYIDNIQKEEIRANLTKYVTNPAAAEWFSSRYRVITERSVIKVSTQNGKKETRTLRPDRVIIDSETQKVTIIDYKFGEKKDPKHIKQVSEYVELYKKTGHASVTGFIYYFEGLEIVEV